MRVCESENIFLDALLLLAAPAAAHEFYPSSCCSGTDCAPLASSRVRVTPDGYVIDGRHLIPFGKALFSPDENFHGCFPPTMLGKVGCFWAPQNAM